MRILYLDTTTNFLYACLSINNNIAGKINEKLDKDLSVFTLYKVKEMLDSCNTELKDIDKIIVVNGPGSFTGIRVGVTIAKTLAFSNNTKISTISSLEAMAKSSNKEVDYYIPVIDARRNNCYAAIFDRNNNEVLKQNHMSQEALKIAISTLPGEYVIISNDNIEFDNIEKYEPNFEVIIDSYKDKEELNPHTVNPCYLKLTEAEEKKKDELI